MNFAFAYFSVSYTFRTFALSLNDFNALSRSRLIFAGDGTMKDWKKLVVDRDSSILNTVEVIDKCSAQVAVALENDGRLAGIITDGDVRRAILKGVELTQPVESIMKTECQVVLTDTPPDEILETMRRKGLRHMPLVDNNGIMRGMMHFNDFVSMQTFDNPVVIMAGGLGTRLYPLTENCPKPMLKVGDKPMLHTIIENFSNQGFSNFHLSVNYKAEMVKDYFKDGEHLGVSIDYIEETTPLGTAGALSLIKGKFSSPMIVINGDVLTKVNFQNLIEFHTALNSMATMCIRDYDLQVPYGVVEVDHYAIKRIQEKPVHKHFVNAGIYVLSPDALELIPDNQFFDMPDLFDALLKVEKIVTSFPIREYWVDVGRRDDFDKANDDYNKTF